MESLAETYNTDMSNLSATKFRQTLFPTLDRTLHGEVVEITYKGSTVRLIAGRNTSKLARARKRNAIVGDPGSIGSASHKLFKVFEEEWRKESEEI